MTRFGRQHDTTFDVTIENRGVEIEAPSGASVKSVGQGEVAFAGAVSGFGNVLIVQHGGGLFSVYGRLETFLVKQGEAVKKGTVVGAAAGIAVREIGAILGTACGGHRHRSDLRHSTRPVRSR